MDLDVIKKLPLVALHAVLARLEAQIDKEARAIGGDTLHLWENWHPDNDVDYLYGVSGRLRFEFREVSKIVRQKEWVEIQELIARRAA